MSFSFGFSNADFSDDELDVSEAIPVDACAAPQWENPLDSVSSDLRAAQIEPLQEVLATLKSVRLTFETYRTAHTTVFRRELYDVKHQLMSEDNHSREEDAELQILMGETNEDVRRNVYEGGLKSWECSIDLVDHLYAQENILGKGVVELGCGTALPSCFLFQQALKNGSAATFTLSDYNSSVLRLVTVPNLLITWCSTLDSETLVKLQLAEDPALPIVADEIQVTGQLIEAFLADLQYRNIKINLISGAWSREFLKLVPRDEYSLVLSSETIYQPDTLPTISETLIELSEQLCIVAAKDIYFGVGGSVVEFEMYLRDRIKSGLPLEFETRKVSAGLKRSIVRMKRV